MASVEQFFSILDNRRSIYTLSNESTISSSQLEDIIKKVLLTTPSAFNTQSTRIIVLLADQHHKLWNIVESTIKPLSPPEAVAGLEAKLKAFTNAYATILFFEDASTYDHLSAFKLYADKFESWRDQTSGMHQLLVWSILEAEGMGANLQHYNPVIDDKVKAEWGIDERWKLISQMVIGKPIDPRPAPKEKKPVEDRYRIIS